MAGDWLMRDQLPHGKGKGICPPTHSSYVREIDYSGADYQTGEWFGRLTLTPFFLLPDRVE